MTDFFLDIIDLNEEVDYSLFLTLFCSYLLVLWVVISVWVGTDALKRYNNRNIAILFAILTFLLNFPVLIFYFIVRPEHKLEEYDEWEVGGVNVPMVNFLGKDGVDMVLQLKINPSKIVPNDNDMRIDVSWDSVQSNMQLVSKTPKTKTEEQGSSRAEKKYVNIFSKWGNVIRKRIQKVKEISTEYKQENMKKSEKKKSVDKSLPNKKSRRNKNKKKASKKNKQNK